MHAKVEPTIYGGPRIAFKLMRVTRDGDYKSLFIKKTKTYSPGPLWYEAKRYPTKGFAVRTGFHCLAEPHAPHLSKKRRVWVTIQIRDYQVIQRPSSQGGTWYIAKYMRIL